MKLANLNTEQCHKDFGKFINEARLKLGYAQHEIATIVGITQSYISYIESGKRDVDLVLALKLCEALNLDIKDFVEKYM